MASFLLDFCKSHNYNSPMDYEVNKLKRAVEDYHRARKAIVENIGKPVQRSVIEWPEGFKSPKNFGEYPSEHQKIIISAKQEYEKISLDKFENEDKWRKAKRLFREKLGKTLHPELKPEAAEAFGLNCLVDRRLFLAKQATARINAEKIRATSSVTPLP